MGSEAWFDTRREADGWTMLIGGNWELPAVARLDENLRRVTSGSAPTARIDLTQVERLDTAGAWLVVRTAQQLRSQGIRTSYSGATDSHAALLKLLEDAAREGAPAPPHPPALIAWLAGVGERTVDGLQEGRALLSFFGMILLILGRVLLRPTRIRVNALVTQMERSGLDALPIVGLLSFLVGVVLSYQGALQLRAFGAEIYTVDLLGVSILREIGILLTAIILAGRSGSAFAAEIGTMGVNQELDAMRTIGLDPMEVLVVPRIAALILTLPLVTFFANVAGLLGGAVMAMLYLDMPLVMFGQQLQAAVTPTMLWVGLVKAPVFAFIIGMVGCYQGLRVSGNAESVGQHTTKAVVQGIFLVIIADAIFSVLFSMIGL